MFNAVSINTPNKSKIPKADPGPAHPHHPFEFFLLLSVHFDYITRMYFNQCSQHAMCV